MNPKQFLLIGGAVLVLIAVLGFAGVIGPSPDKSVFGGNWWFDNGENWAHLVIGVAGLLAVFTLPANLQKLLVIVLGIVGILVGLWSLVLSTNFLGANLENPADTILHLAVGAWALLAARGKKSMSIS